MKADYGEHGDGPKAIDVRPVCSGSSWFQRAATLQRLGDPFIVDVEPTLTGDVPGAFCLSDPATLTFFAVSYRDAPHSGRINGRVA